MSGLTSGIPRSGCAVAGLLRPVAVIAALAAGSVTAVMGAGPAAAASFDCARASAEDERLICADPALDAADGAVGAAYKALSDALAGDEAGRTLVRAGQRGWIAARNRSCGIPRRGVPAPDDATVADCFRTAMDRRVQQLQRLRTNLPLGARLRASALAEGKPGDRFVVRAAYPEIADASITGAAFFNDAMRRFVGDEVRRFRADAIDLPPAFEANLDIDYDVYFPAPGMISVQFHASGVMGNGVLYDLAATVDLNRGRLITVADLFTGTGWLTTAAAVCRGAVPAMARDTCAEPGFAAARTWRMEPGRLVATVLLPGKELREIPVPLAQLSAHLRPGAPLR